MGHISKEGNRLLRWLLVGAALQALCKHGPLRSTYVRIQQRKGNKIARVALARHLAEVVYHVWEARDRLHRVFKASWSFGGELEPAHGRDFRIGQMIGQPPPVF